MTALPGILLGPIGAAALRFPKTIATLTSTGAFIKKHWGAIAMIGCAAAACVSAYIYVGHIKRTAYATGFATAETQYKAAVDAANKVAQNDQHQLDLLKLKYDDLSKARQIQVVTVTKPNIERIIREVQSAPVYRSCLLTDGVFHDLQAEAAGVNASIDSSQR